MGRILRGGFFSTDQPSTLGITARQLERFRHALERAMCHANRMGDLEATTLIAAGAGLDTVAPSILDWQSETSKKLRSAQIAYLCSLDTADLAFLFKMVQLAGSGYERYHQGVEFLTAHNAAERKRAFEELTLRRGSLTIYALVRGGGALFKYAREALADTTVEMMARESDKQYKMPTLNMTLTKELKKRLLSVQHLGLSGDSGQGAKSRNEKGM